MTGINFNNWNTPKHWKVLKTIDLHTAGEPLRVFIDGLPEIKGNTILEKRKYFRDNYDYIRTGTMWEPRGHADMYGAIITEPVTPDGDFGVFFLHNEGYSTMCGHAIIALTTLCINTGMIKKESSDPVINIETPAGRITANAKMENGEVKEVSFLNVPSFVLKQDQLIDIPGIGKVNYDIAYGGAFYAFCKTKDLNIELCEKNYSQLIDLGRKIKNSIKSQLEIKHPFEEELGFLYGTIITGPPHNPSNHSRNVCVFADGELDRSPTGTGVSARAAIHYSKNELLPGQSITIESILGTCFNVKIIEITKFGPYTAIIPEVTGSAYITGRNNFYFDPEDPLKKGFILR